MSRPGGPWGLGLMRPGCAVDLGRARFWVGLFAAIYISTRIPTLLSQIHVDPARFDPVGLCAWLPRPLHPATVWAQSLLVPLASVAFALGWRFRVVGPAAALLVAWTLSYRNSFGMVFHTENLLVLHMLLLGFTRSADAWSWDARRREGPPPHGSDYQWPLRVLATITVLSYLVAGLAKLRYGGWSIHWLDGDLLRAQVAFDNLRKEALDHIVAPLGPWLVRREAVFPILAWATMLLELGAPLLLLWPRLVRPWVLGVWGFHLGVLLTMAILFPYPLTGVAFVGLLRCDRLWRWTPLRRLAERAFGESVELPRDEVSALPSLC